MNLTPEQVRQRNLGRVTSLIAWNIPKNLGTEAYQDLGERIDWPTLEDSRASLEGKTPICIGAGPSLEDNGLDLHAADRDRFFLVATDSSIRWLLAHGIVPDVGVSSELEGACTRPSGLPGTEPLIEGLTEQTTFPLWAPYACNPSLTALWGGPIHWYVDGGFRYRKWYEIAPYVYPGNAVVVTPMFLSCGGHAIACCERLGAREIILVGYDWQVRGDRHHCDHYTGLAGLEEQVKALEIQWQQWQTTNNGAWTIDPAITITNCTPLGRFHQDMTLRDRLEK